MRTIYKDRPPNSALQTDERRKLVCCQLDLAKSRYASKLPRNVLGNRSCLVAKCLGISR